MRPSEVVARAEGYLSRHGVADARVDAEWLLRSILELDRAGLYARSEPLSPSQARASGRALCRRCEGVPLQHLTREQTFRNLHLEVRPGVFIPRQETEVVVEAALERMAAVEAPSVVDCCTGSGAIALAIKQERPEATVVGTDVSEAAVDLARANAERLGLDVAFRLGDLVQPVGELRGALDLLVANPPYVEADAMGSLPVEVRADPVGALVGGTELHERLAAAAAEWLKPGGWLVLEIGDDQGDEVAGILGRHLGDVDVLPDLSGRDRVAVGRR